MDDPSNIAYDILNFTSTGSSSGPHRGIRTQTSKSEAQVPPQPHTKQLEAGTEYNKCAWLKRIGNAHAIIRK